MKISSKDKEKNRKKILNAAVNVITEKGFRAATMREISRKAGLSEAAIYNYFPTKEKLVFGYYLDTQAAALHETEDIPDFGKMSLREQFHLYVETNLEKFLPAREFVAETFAMAFAVPFIYAEDAAAIRTAFVASSKSYLEEAVEKGEIPAQPFIEFIAAMSWDFYILTVSYWLADDSEGFNNTTAMLDKSLAVKEAVLKSGVIPKGVELMTFMVRTSLAGWMGRWPVAAARAAKDTHGKRKKQRG